MVRAVPLDRITDATVDAGPSGDGTITLIVDDGTRPRLADVADAQGVRTTLLAARAHFRGRTRMRGLLIWGPIYLAISWAMAGAESGVGPKVIAAILSLIVVALGIAVVSIDAELRFNTLYAITDRRVLVLGWEWRRGRRTFRLPFTAMRYCPSIAVRATGAGTSASRPTDGSG